MTGDTRDCIRRAREMGLAVPAFNIPYLPMMEPVVRAVRDSRAFALVAVARLEWIKFQAGGPEAVRREFERCADTDWVRLHLDHVPVVDEDGERVDYRAVLAQAIDLGYQSVMIDGSRLSLDENIACTREAVEMAHRAGIPCEAELGAVLGHEEGPLPSYEELFRTKMGFTRIDEARRFTVETECDWLSVSIGNVHGAVSAARRDEKKVAARLDLEHVEALHRATGIPLVLHGGSGVQRESVLGAVARGIAKINIGTEIRQAYEAGLRDEGQAAGRERVYARTRELLGEYLGLEGTGPKVTGRD